MLISFIIAVWRDYLPRTPPTTIRCISLNSDRNMDHRKLCELGGEDPRQYEPWWNTPSCGVPLVSLVDHIFFRWSFVDIMLPFSTITGDASYKNHLYYIVQKRSHILARGWASLSQLFRHSFQRFNFKADVFALFPRVFYANEFVLQFSSTLGSVFKLIFNLNQYRFFRYRMSSVVSRSPEWIFWVKLSVVWFVISQ